MNQEILFGQTLEQIKKKAKQQGNVIAKADVEAAFAPLGLNETQLSMVYDYLKTHKIGVDEEVNLDDYLDHTDRNYLEMYLEELKQLKEYSDGEKEAITIAAMAGESDAKQELITIYLNEAVDLAKLYTGQGVIIEDLIGEANLALAMGVEMLGALEHPSEVSGMLGKMMMDAMEDAIAESNADGEKGKMVAEKVNKVADAAKELAQELRRKVTIEELMQETGMDREEVMEAIRLSANKIEDIEV